MRCVIFTHSLVSDWNHGNAHFLRGIAAEFLARGWEMRIFEPRNGWSRRNLIEQYGDDPLDAFAQAFPHLRSTLYDLDSLNLKTALDGADLVLVHEWNEPELIDRIGNHRSRRAQYQLFFHDTHHRMITAPESVGSFNLRNYDGVLAYGRVLRDIYHSRFRISAWTWHEAADVRIFHPRRRKEKYGDVVWVGNWGDDERAQELREFFIRPVQQLGLKAAAYGVRYPESALAELAGAGIEYKGWLPNYRVPEVFSRYRFTLHVPRRPYVSALHGIPTIRPLEAMACGIPLISSPWQDSEDLFEAGHDYLVARDGNEMVDLMRGLLLDPNLAARIGENGLRTIRSRHTCRHRIDELLRITKKVEEAGAFQGVA